MMWKVQIFQKKTKCTHTRSTDLPHQSKNTIANLFLQVWLMSPPPTKWKWENLSSTVHQIPSLIHPRDEFREPATRLSHVTSTRVLEINDCGIPFCCSAPRAHLSVLPPCHTAVIYRLLKQNINVISDAHLQPPPPPSPSPTASFPPPILRRGIAGMPLKVAYVRLTCRNDQESDFRCHVFIVWKKRHSLHLLWCGHKAKRTQEVVAVEAREAGKCTTVRHGSELCTVSAVRCFISVRSEQSLKKKKRRKKLKLIKMNHHTFFFVLLLIFYNCHNLTMSNEVM